MKRLTLTMTLGCMLAMASAQTMRFSHVVSTQDAQWQQAATVKDGNSTWGWRQNALVRVDSRERTYTLTPEFYAVAHASQYITNGSRLIYSSTADKLPVLVYQTPEQKVVVVAGNLGDEEASVNLNVSPTQAITLSLPAHSFHTLNQN